MSVWPNGVPEIGARASRSRTVRAEELPGPGTVLLKVEWSFPAPVRPGDRITGEVEVQHARDDKPIARLMTTVVRNDRTVVLEGSTLTYTSALGGG